MRKNKRSKKTRRGGGVAEMRAALQKKINSGATSTVAPKNNTAYLSRARVYGQCNAGFGNNGKSCVNGSTPRFPNV